METTDRSPVPGLLIDNKESGYVSGSYYQHHYRSSLYRQHACICVTPIHVSPIHVSPIYVFTIYVSMMFAGISAWPARTSLAEDAYC